MRTRKEFPLLLNKRGLLGLGVEVGACRGYFSERLLKHWHGQTLYSIDSWIHQPAVKMDASNVSNREHDENYECCKALLAPFGKRSSIMRGYSVDVAKYIREEILAFAYIDARHDYRSVWADLCAWWPKIISGGILAGHDYKNSFVRNNLVEVKRAVDNFSYQYNLKVHVTTEDNLPSWYIFKP